MMYLKWFISSISFGLGTGIGLFIAWSIVSLIIWICEKICEWFGIGSKRW